MGRSGAGVCVKEVFPAAQHQQPVWPQNLLPVWFQQDDGDQTRLSVAAVRSHGYH